MILILQKSQKVKVRINTRNKIIVRKRNIRGMVVLGCLKNKVNVFIVKIKSLKVKLMRSFLQFGLQGLEFQLLILSFGKIIIVIGERKVIIDKILVSVVLIYCVYLILIVFLKFFLLNFFFMFFMENFVLFVLFRENKLCY